MTTVFFFHFVRDGQPSSPPRKGRTATKNSRFPHPLPVRHLRSNVVPIPVAAAAGYLLPTAADGSRIVPVFHVGDEMGGDRNRDSNARNSSSPKHDSGTGSDADVAGVTPSSAAAEAPDPVGEDDGDDLEAETQTARKSNEDTAGATPNEHSSASGAVQAAAADDDDAAATTTTTPVTKDAAREDSGQSTDLGGEDGDEFPSEPLLESQKAVAAGQTAAVVATAGGDDAELLPVRNSMSTGWNGGRESSGGAPGSASDSNDSSSTRKRESRTSQSKARSERRVTRKASRRSAAALGRRSGGKGSASVGSSDGAAAAAPANHRNLQAQYTNRSKHTYIYI